MSITTAIYFCAEGQFESSCANDSLVEPAAPFWLSPATWVVVEAPGADGTCVTGSPQSGGTFNFKQGYNLSPTDCLGTIDTGSGAYALIAASEVTFGSGVYQVPPVGMFDGVTWDAMGPVYAGVLLLWMTAWGVREIGKTLGLFT